jgi:hypothetical protein
VTLLTSAIAVLAAATNWTPWQDPNHVHRVHHRRSKPKPDPPPMRGALASWYAEHGTGACGVGDVQSGYRFASLILACGTRIRICHGARCVEATMSDHGPYVSGRTFDLNENLRAVLACPDLCWVNWRIG